MSIEISAVEWKVETDEDVLETNGQRSGLILTVFPNLQVGEIDEYSSELRYEVRRSTRSHSKPVELKAHEFAAPLAPVKKDEIKSEEEENDDETIIIDNDIPFRYSSKLFTVELTVF